VFAEGFNGCVRYGCLNEHWFEDWTDAQPIISDWRTHYNQVGLQSPLVYMTPATFKQQMS
jgi:putative transposase